MELLVVLAIVALMIALLMPALAGARAAARTVVCANHIRQIGLSTFAYANRHRGRLPIPGVQPNGTGGLPESAVWATDNQWVLDFNQGTLIPDLGGPAVAEQLFKCPDDVDSNSQVMSVTLTGDQDHPWQVTGRDFKTFPRNYSYLWNARAYVYHWPAYPGFFQGLQLGRIRQPAQKFLFFENAGDARQLAAGPVTYDETTYAEKAHLFIGMRHRNRSNVFYCDGHVELFDSRSFKDDSVSSVFENLAWLRHIKLDQE